MTNINKIINEKKEYKIRISDYEEYIKINGIKRAKCPQALEVRDKTAIYYIIEQNGDFVDDFCIFIAENWITLDERLYLDDQITKSVIDFIKNDFKYIIFYIPERDEDLLEAIKNKYSNLEVTETKQGEYKFYKVKMLL